MNKKEIIENRFKSLKDKEDKSKLQLSHHSDEIRDKAKQVGKIALTVGIIAVLGYWIFNALFHKNDIGGERKKEKKKKKQSKSTWARLAPIVIPYANEFLDRMMSSNEEKSKSIDKNQENLVKD